MVPPGDRMSPGGMNRPYGIRHSFCNAPGDIVIPLIIC
jgi:hypothetical protein